jgi:UDP-N-acetylmuramate dehydrogenase
MFDPSAFLDRCPAEMRDKVMLGHSLARLTTLKVGGPAAVVCPVGTLDEARRFQEICHEIQAPCYILGAGSNVLAPDAGFSGVILKIALQDFQLKDDRVQVGAGLDFDTMIELSLNEGLTGLEFASGIPGTLGGALVGNAGCYGHEIGEFLEEAVILRADGRLETVGPEAFGFTYRHTQLRETGDLVLQATLCLRRGDIHEAGRTREEKIADRLRKHPGDLPSAGSWFRNLPPDGPDARRRAAGQLLEQAGAKSMSEGDARVFHKHANMIINTGSATSMQVRTLADRMAQAVEKKFGVKLVEEVRTLT